MTPLHPQLLTQRHPTKKIVEIKAQVKTYKRSLRDLVRSLLAVRARGFDGNHPHGSELGVRRAARRVGATVTAALANEQPVPRRREELQADGGDESKCAGTGGPGKA